VANFTWTPDLAVEAAPDYAVRITPTADQKEERKLISATPTRRFSLLFKVATEAVKDAIFDHFEGQSGPLTSFTWTTCPSYLNASGNQTVRYESLDCQPIPESVNLWRITAGFVMVV